MATQTVIDEKPPDGVPFVSTGNFFWKPTNQKMARLAASAKGEGTTASFRSLSTAPVATAKVVPTEAQLHPGPPPLSTVAGANVLALLEMKTFAGKGFNTIWRPRSVDELEKPGQQGHVDGNTDVLQLNLTQETLSFGRSLGTVPNRGNKQQPDVLVVAVPYTQSVQDITNPATGLADLKLPTDIHFEPGVWLAVPETKIPVQNPTLCRMASIPHGTTINAQGVQPNLKDRQPKPAFKPVSIVPFVIGNPDLNAQANVGLRNAPFMKNLKVNSVSDRIPSNVPLFDTKRTITQDMLNNPNVFLSKTIEGQDIADSLFFEITTRPTPVLGGGTANIAFLGGNSPNTVDKQNQAGPDANAHAVSMDAQFWIETVRINLKPFIQLGQSVEQPIKPFGNSGPEWWVPSTMGRTVVPDVNLTFMQIQYSQQVLLNFNGLTWPHVSVATLAETTKFQVTLPP